MVGKGKGINGGRSSWASSPGLDGSGCVGKPGSPGPGSGLSMENKKEKEKQQNNKTIKTGNADEKAWSPTSSGPLPLPLFLSSKREGIAHDIDQSWTPLPMTSWDEDAPTQARLKG